MERAHVPVLEALASIPERRLSDWRCPVDHAGTVLQSSEMRCAAQAGPMLCALPFRTHWAWEAL